MVETCKICTGPIEEDGKCRMQWYHDFNKQFEGKAGGTPAGITGSDIKPKSESEPNRFGRNDTEPTPSSEIRTFPKKK